MTEPADQTPPEKDTTWIWVVGVVVVLCLCCSLAAAVAGFIYVRENGLTLPNLTLPGPKVPTPIPPAATSAPLAVQPYDPSLGQLQALPDLVPNWQPSTLPGVNTWQASVTASQAILVFVGWCAVDQPTLASNQQHLVWSLAVDGVDVAVKSLYLETGPGQQGFCQDYAGVINTWPVGQHVIKTTMHLDQSINDGWSPYPGGDYVDIYQVTVTP
jgi:hypothetical protein